MAALQTASTETVEKVFYEQLEAQTPAVPTSPGACASMVSVGKLRPAAQKVYCLCPTTKCPLLKG